ncbi:hypothetical protein ACTVZO_41370 [Streptomyces sp. IBSNAI002]|uniref:hypothetical protein n=1 Tax=Streptomyces sp. IBSNAI002 TaxID=3457500 RepID=UPI003FD47C6D
MNSDSACDGGTAPVARGGDADGGPTEAPQGVVAALIPLAGQLGLREVDVDDLVYDIVHRDASNAYNSGGQSGLSSLDAFDAVLDGADGRTSAINNGGLEVQVSALVEGVRGAADGAAAAGHSGPVSTPGRQPPELSYLIL